MEIGSAAAQLRAMWESDDLPELASLAEDLVKLARHIELTEDPSADVDPFMYVMY